jgi:hypothetical protein
METVQVEGVFTDVFRKPAADANNNVYMVVIPGMKVMRQLPRSF